MKSAEEARFELATESPLCRFSKRVGFSAITIACALFWGAPGALVGCGPTPGDPPEITGACVRSFASTLAEWERLFGERAPEHCRFLDADYDVQLVSAADMPPPPVCEAGAVGCTVPSARVVYLLAGRDDIATVDTSVHEWIHALSACVLGDPDVGHHRSGLWEPSRPTSVEVQAQAAAVLGECLP